MAVRALLLDFDGTLADSLPALRRVYERFVSHLGGSPTSDGFDALNGPPLREVVKRLCSEHQGRPHLPDDLDLYQELIAEELVRIHPAPGSRELIHAARSRGIRCAIVTSGPMSLVRSWLQSTAFEVDVIISGDDVAEGKPSPAPYQLALQKLGVPAGEALAIEDSESGVRSATAAGVRVLRLSNVRTSDATSIGKLTEALDYLEP